MKYGLKLWSTNDYYINEAIKLYKEGIYNYIELFIVPDSLKYIELWENLNIPYILHPPHSMTEFNPSKSSCEVRNLELLKEIEEYKKALNPKYIIFHPGLDGTLKETIIQFNTFSAKFADIFKIALIENKPAVGLNGEKCIGSSPKEIGLILLNTQMQFCYDIGHCFCFAKTAKLDWKEVFQNFLDLKPKMYHLSDGDINSEKDKHFNIGKGNFDLKYILKKIEKESVVTIETNKSSKEKLDDFRDDIKIITSLDRFK